jgi:phage FluMu protein Com
VTTESLTMMRCERCRAVLCNAEAPALIRAGTPCGVCGGVLVLAGSQARVERGAPADDPEGQRTPMS